MDLLEHVRAFAAVAEARSFTRGAERCGVPQPVASRRVAALERELGGRLLVRSPRRVELTALGTALLPAARDLVARADRFRVAARAHAPGLALAVPPGLAPTALAALRRTAREAGTTLTLEEAGPVRRTRLLAARDVDAALLAVPDDEALLGATLGVATGPDARRPVLRGRRVHLEQLRRAAGDTETPRCLHLDAEDDVPWVRDRLRTALGAAGVRPDQLVVGAAESEVLARVLDDGDAALAPRGWAEGHGLRWRALGDLDLVRGYAVRPARPAPRQPGVAGTSNDLLTSPAVLAALRSAWGPA